MFDLNNPYIVIVTRSGIVNGLYPDWKQFSGEWCILEKAIVICKGWKCKKMRLIGVVMHIICCRERKR
jgi:hypothetical protein